jgi:hypothetical protein
LTGSCDDEAAALARAGSLGVGAGAAMLSAEHAAASGASSNGIAL